MANQNNNRPNNNTIAGDNKSPALVENIVCPQVVPVKEMKGINDEILLIDDECDAHHSISLLEIPKYLSMTTNKIFENMLQQKLDYATATLYDLNRIREIAILMHQLTIIDLEKSLWTVYFESGTGNILKSNEPTLKVWPTCIKVMILSSVASKQNNTINNTNQMEIHNNNNNENDDDICLKFVNNYLHDLNEKQQQIQEELSEKKKHLYGHAEKIEHILQNFIEQHLRYLRLQYEHKIKYINLNYHENVVEDAFRQQNLTEQQKKIIKRLFERKYKHETAQEKVHLMQQQVAHNKLSTSLACMQSSLPSLILTLTNRNLRQQLTAHHDNITNQYKSEIIIIFTKIIEAELRESKKLFINEMAKFWQDQCSFPLDQRLNKTTIDLVHYGLMLIINKIKCFSNYRELTITGH